MDRLGRFPTIGDGLTVDDVRIDVLSLDRHVPGRVRIAHLPPAAEEAQA
ncbi:hypothetical protein ACWGBV_34700 [Streptomyces sp. NPDC055051]